MATELNKFPANEWITNVHSYTNPRQHDLEIIHCLGSYGENDIINGIKYISFEYDKKIIIDFNFANFDNYKSNIKHVIYVDKLGKSGLANPKDYKIFSLDGYSSSVFKGVIWAIFDGRIKTTN